MKNSGLMTFWLGALDMIYLMIFQIGVRLQWYELGQGGHSEKKRWAEADSSDDRTREGNNSVSEDSGDMERPRGPADER